MKRNHSQAVRKTILRLIIYQVKDRQAKLTKLILICQITISQVSATIKIWYPCQTINLTLMKDNKLILKKVLVFQ